MTTKRILYISSRIIPRAEFQIKLIDILKDVDIGLKIELSIFEYSLIYCQNNITTIPAENSANNHKIKLVRCPRRA